MASLVDTMRPASDRAPWWAGQEDKIAKAKTAKAVLKLAGADWGVEKWPLYAHQPDIDPATGVHLQSGPAEGFSGLVRTDDKSLLYVVGDRYQPVQNGDTLSWARSFGDLIGVWTMKGGRVVGATVKPTPASHDGLRGEEGVLYAHALNWHGDGGLELHYSFVRTENQTVHVAPSVYVRSLNDQLAGVVAYQRLADRLDQLVVLANKSANQRTLMAAYERVWPKPPTSATKAVTRWNNRRDEILTVWLESPTLEGIRDTQWGVLNAFAEWAQWGRAFRGSGGDEAVNDQLRGEEILFGHSREVYEKTLAYFNPSTNKKGKA